MFTFKCLTKISSWFRISLETALGTLGGDINCVPKSVATLVRCPLFPQSYEEYFPLENIPNELGQAENMRMAGSAWFIVISFRMPNSCLCLAI